MSKKEMTCYVVAHKPIATIPAPNRVIIAVGEFANVSSGLRDNTGDNISNKNQSFCELTALYWIWKNDKKSSFISFEHYRRFFLCKKESPLEYRIQTKNGFLELMNKFDIVVPRPVFLSKFNTLWDAYSHSYGSDDLIKTRKVIMKVCPEYLPDFDFVVCENKKISYFNMLVSSKDVLNQYCSWLFGILFCLEPDIDLSKKLSYKKRVFGFLSERLINVWLYHNRDSIKIGYADVCNVDERPLKHYLIRAHQTLYNFWNGYR
jgi:hypothetical protein